MNWEKQQRKIATKLLTAFLVAGWDTDYAIEESVRTANKLLIALKVDNARKEQGGDN